MELDGGSSCILCCCFLADKPIARRDVKTGFRQAMSDSKVQHTLVVGVQAVANNLTATEQRLISELLGTPVDHSIPN